MNPQPRNLAILNVVTLLLVIAATLVVFIYAPIEANMGRVQKIFYFHIATAWVGMLGFLVAVIAAVAVLGSIGLLAGGLRTLIILFVSKEDQEAATSPEPLAEPPEDLGEDLPSVAPEIRSRRILSWVVFAGFMAAFLLIGLFPQRYLPFIRLFSQIFQQLGT